MYDYVAGKVDWLAAGMDFEGELADIPRAKDIARKDSPTCSLTETVGDARARTKSAGVDVCVVVNEARVVLGILRTEELGQKDSMRVEDAMKPGPSTFRPHVQIAEMADYMEHHDLTTAPITTSDGKLLGVLFKEDALKAAKDGGHEQ